MRKKRILSRDTGKKYFPIVGIGGSAGGLEAFQGVLKNISHKPGVALVFIMHLTPGHKSLLAELLAKITKMPVCEITNGMVPEINHVYVKPPNANLILLGGRFTLSALEGEGIRRMPIDSFFRSLADEFGNRSIGVIMSGTATDGTLGAEAIKAEGGITFAQDQKSAKYNDMPQSAIAAGCVDFMLSPKKIARELERIAKHPFISSTAQVLPDKQIITEDKGLESIFDILRRAKGLDFTYYKAATISRRVSRRVVLAKQGNLKNYIKFLRGNNNEVGKLYEDLLINVTGFFRDEKVFQALEKSAIPVILKNKTKDQSVRIWVPGCSSGEEAYSIAMLFAEALGRKVGMVPVQIFATDVSEEGINKARRGIYGPSIKDGVGPMRLKRFFTKEGNYYKISKSLREMCVFSRQNVFGDPPFSNIDLISCRNLLIYLQPVLQKKVFHNFHYSLRPGGFLALGNSESISGYSNLFKDLDRKQKIFVKKYVSIRPGFELGQGYHPPKGLEVKKKIDTLTGKETDIAGLADRIVLNEYAPCGVLIDSNMEVVQFRGHTGRFLESSEGKPSHDIFKLAREGLLMPLRAAIYKARETKNAVKRVAEDVLCNGRKVSVTITVVPVKSAALKEELFLVLFDEIGRIAGFKNLPRGLGKISLKGRSVKKDNYIKDLQKELVETKEYLQTVIEEQENACEEVKTANEEILSSNEELQSTNEELETAKEELQSSNEELTTTNEELRNRNAEVSLLNNDLINLLGSFNFPVVMLGIDLMIRRVTPQADEVLNIASSDVGRPINKVKLNIDIPDFQQMLLDVIDSLHPKMFEIKDKEVNWYSVYIRPYRTMDNKIDGVVVVFVDITERKKSEQAVEESRDYAENIIGTIQESLIVVNDDLRVISANRSFYQAFKVSPKGTVGCFLYDLGDGEWNIPELRQLMGDILTKKTTIDDYEIEHRFEAIGQKTMLFNARRLANMHMILIAIEDITERRQMERELVQSKERQYKTLIDNLPQKIFLKDRNSVYISCNENYARDLKIRPEEIAGKTDYDFYHEDLAEKYRADDKRIMESGKTEDLEEKYIQDKEERFVHTIKTFVKDAQGNVTGILGIFWDITERKKMEDQLLFAAKEWRTTFDSITDLVSIHDKDFKITRVNKAFADVFKMKPQEVIGKTCYTLVHETKEPPSSCPHKQVMQTKKPISVEFFEPHLGMYLEITCSPVFDQGGEVVATVHLAKDITMHKEMEKEQRLAQLGKLVADMAHEVNNPLMIISGNAQLSLMENIQNETVNNNLKIIFEESKRAKNIIQRLLKFSRPSKGELQVIDINKNIEAVLGIVEHQFNLANIQIKRNYAGNLPSILIDEQQMQEVFMNLLSNANDAMPESGVIEVTTSLEGDYFRIDFKDTGCGMSEEVKKRLFEPFFTTKEKGTGLGLSVCYGIIKVHNGELKFESELGKGTTATILLPIKEGKA